MTATALHVAFPGTSFLSQAEFDRHCAEQQSVLDARFAYEQQQASHDRGGTCAPCLRATRFATLPSPGPDAAPDWREGQTCGCPHRLGQRARAMLHHLGVCGALAPWGRVVTLGPSCPIAAHLAAACASTTHRPRLLPGRRVRMDAPDSTFTLAVAWDYLHRVPPLADALAAIAACLAPGGRFVFSIPFHYRAARTVSRLGHVPRRAGHLPADFRGEVHEIGWDILDRLADAGFRHSAAIGYWSDELGYLGSHNMLFSAAI